MRYSNILLSATVVATMTFTGCGSDDTTTSTGVLLDSAVEGIQYFTATQSGTTDATGSFTYVAGETVEFKLANISLGTVTPGAEVFPTDLVGDKNVSATAVVNMLRLLQTLDADQNPSNGISIPTAIQTASFTAFDLSSESALTAFMDEANATYSYTNFAYVDAVSASAHFAETKQKLAFGTDVTVDINGSAVLLQNVATATCDALSTTAASINGSKYVSFTSENTCADLGFLGTVTTSLVSGASSTTVTNTNGTACISTDYSGADLLAGTASCGYVMTR